MLVPLVLLLMSLGGIWFGIIRPDLADLSLVAVPSALASLILLLREAIRQGRSPDETEPDWPSGKITRPARKIIWPGSQAPPPAPNWIVVDGSNVMYWKDNTPRIETVREVLAELAALGFTAGVVFDANAGYLISGRYEHHGSIGRMVGLPEDRVMVVPRGEPADATVLASARDLRARIVTNDRYRDWAEQHPEVRTPGHLIRGGYRDGALWLALVTPSVTVTATV